VFGPLVKENKNNKICIEKSILYIFKSLTIQKFQEFFTILVSLTSVLGTLVSIFYFLGKLISSKIHFTLMNDILTSNFQQLLGTTFFLYSYWTITIERKRKRENKSIIRVWKRVVTKVVKIGCQNIIPLSH